MVVCKCRKATKLYCFVHKVPLCGECICFSEHQICVVRSYSEWVIDGEYDWPPGCSRCQVVLEGTNLQTTRLGCLHVMHTDCLVSYIKGLSQPLVLDECVCPACSTRIWPPKSIKDPGSNFYLKLREAIDQSGFAKIIFGDDQIAGQTQIRGPPPAFDSTPLLHVSNVEDGDGTTSSSRFVTASGSNNNQENTSSNGPGVSIKSVTDIIEVEDTPSSTGPPSISNHDSGFLKSTSSTPPGATTRKTGAHIDSQNSEMYYYADDEDGNKKKYTRRGPFRHKFLRALLPFWSTALPTLPVTVPPPRKNGEDTRKHQRPSRLDPRKVLLFIAIMACMGTMGILYYRILQRGAGQIGGGEAMAADDEQ